MSGLFILYFEVVSYRSADPGVHFFYFPRSLCKFTCDHGNWPRQVLDHYGEVETEGSTDRKTEWFLKCEDNMRVLPRAFELS